MAGPKDDTIDKILQKLKKVVEKNEELESAMAKKNYEIESEMMKYQNELLVLKRDKLDLKRLLDETTRQVNSLKATIEDLKSLSQHQTGGIDLNTKGELASIKENITNLEDELLKIKKNKGIRASSNSQTQDAVAINILTERFNQETEKVDIMEKKVDTFLKVFNRAHVSLQSSKDQGISVKEQEACPPLPPRSAALPKINIDNFAQIVLLSSHEEIKKRCKFCVSFPKTLQLQTGTSKQIRGYTKSLVESVFMDRQTGSYRTLVAGNYKFMGTLKQKGEGKIALSILLCGGSREWRRSLLLTRDDAEATHMGSVTWTCDKGEDVWLECMRVEGDAEILSCQFDGELLDLNEASLEETRDQHQQDSDSSVECYLTP